MNSGSILVAVILTVVATGCGGDGALGPDDVRDLVPDAAAVPSKLLDEITRRGASVSPRTLETLPLSMLLSAVTFEDSDDLRRIPSGAVTPADLKEMWVNAAGANVTLLPEESLSDIIVVTTEGAIAEGSFRFRRKGLLEGRVEFRAERRDGDWTIVEFHLPGAGATTRLSEDGTWRLVEE